MPKLKNRPPKYSKMGKYAVVYQNGKPEYLGHYNSPESRVVYARIVARWYANPGGGLPRDEKNVTICELTAAFLDHAKVHVDPISYAHYRVAVLDYLDKLYGDGTLVEDFKPSCLKMVRTEMIQSGRFCRRTVNDYTFRIIAIFAWGVENVGA